MPRLHILRQAGPNRYSVVVHAPTPAGNNAAGISWQTALANSGMQAASVLPIGNGPGQITNAESNSVISGAIVEAPFLWDDNPAWDNTTRQEDLNTRAAQAVASVLDEYQAHLRYFGFTVT